MNKTKEELNKLKQEYETLTDKLKELNEDELKEVASGYEPIDIHGLEAIGPYAVGGIPLDSDSKLSK